ERDAWDLIEAEGTQNVLGFGTASDGVWQLARLRDSQKMTELAAAHSPAWRKLSVSVLHVLVQDHLLPQKLGATPACRYIHLLRATLHWVRRHLLLLWFVVLFLVAAGALTLHFWSRHQYHKVVIAMNEERFDDARAALRFCLKVWPRNASSLRLAARIERLS